MTQRPSAAESPSQTAPAQPTEAKKAKRDALLFGIVGLFFLGIVCGPLAIAQAKKAEKLGERATAGKILGWIDLVFGAIAIVGLILNFT